jgi:hypothetical protein
MNKDAKLGVFKPSRYSPLVERFECGFIPLLRRGFLKYACHKQDASDQMFHV